MAKGKKTGGRKPGSLNKVTAPMRKLMADFCEATYEEFIDAFHQIDEPDKKCRIWLDIQGFVTPKLSSVEVKESKSTLSFQEELDALSGES